MAFAARGIEAKALKQTDIEQRFDTQRGPYFQVRFTRAKSVGPPQIEFCVITGELEVAVLSAYIAVFHGQWGKNGDKNSAWRYLKYAKNGVLTVYGNIGHNKLADTGKVLAKAIGLLNWLAFTGHCFRRSTITLLSNRGMPLQG
jgi:hypothetical protein